MMRHKWLAYLLCVLAAMPAQAQTVSRGLTVLGAMFQGMAKDKAEQAQRAQDSIAEAQQEALLSALARSDSADAAQRLQVARDAQARANATARLFWQRASFILTAAADSLSIGRTSSATRDEFFAEGNAPLHDLFAVNPEASNAQMYDVLEPVTAKYKKLYADFLARSELALDSVIAARHVPRAQQMEFVKAALPWLEAKLHSDITADTWSLGQVVGVAADSATAAKPPARPVAARKRKKP